MTGWPLMGLPLFLPPQRPTPSGASAGGHFTLAFGWRFMADGGHSAATGPYAAPESGGMTATVAGKWNKVGDSGVKCRTTERRGFSSRSEEHTSELQSPNN